MTARARLGLCVLAALSALSAVVAQPAGPPPVFAVHESNPAGQIWTAGTAEYSTFIHTNKWECIGKARIKPGSGTTEYGGCDEHTLGESGITLADRPHGTVRTVTCEVSTANPNDGCGHTGNNRWHWVDGPYHAQPNAGKTGSRQCTVPGHTPVHIGDNAAAEHCGVWADCTTGIPNAARTSCVPCPTGQVPNAARSSCVTDTSLRRRRPCARVGRPRRVASSHEPPDYP